MNAYVQSIELELAKLLGIAILGILIALGKLALQWLNAQLGTAKIALSTGTQNELEDAAGKALTFALGQLDEMIRAKGWDHIDVKNAAILAAGSYAIGSFPDVLKRAGIDTVDPVAAAERLSGILTRKFPEVVTAVSASPATPPVVTLPVPVLAIGDQPPATPAA